MQSFFRSISVNAHSKQSCVAKLSQTTLELIPSRDSTHNCESVILKVVVEMGKEDRVPSYKLNTGALMLAVGLGVSAMTESHEETKQYVRKALEIGYRLLDTAKLYKSEGAVGEALQEAFAAGKVKREEVFVTTKIWADDMHPPDVMPALRKSLKELKLDYVDLYLVHWPLRFRKGLETWHESNEGFLPLDLVGCWKALEQGVELGLAKAIGVSNCSTMRLKEIESQAKFLPVVNQMEMHPGCEQAQVREYCNQKGILVTAWSPLGAPGYGEVWGTEAVLESPILKEIAKKHGKTVAEVALRWGLDKGVGLTVRSSSPEMMAQNLDLFDWTLHPEDHEKISAFPPFKLFDGSKLFQFSNFPYKSLKDLWDD